MICFSFSFVEVTSVFKFLFKAGNFGVEFGDLIGGFGLGFFLDLVNDGKRSSKLPRDLIEIRSLEPARSSIVFINQRAVVADDDIAEERVALIGHRIAYEIDVGEHHNGAIFRRLGKARNMHRRFCRLISVFGLRIRL